MSSSSNTEPARLEVLVEMPQMGVSVAEGTLVVWRKAPGDWVSADETICEISTDKIDIEVPSPASGRVVELLVAEEETVPVGTPLARIRAEVAGGQDGVPPTPAAAGRSGGQAAPALDAARETGNVSRHGAAAVSPVVRRIAEEHGIDLRALSGSGREGRVRKQDVLGAVAAVGAGEKDGRGRAGEKAPGVPEPRPASAAPMQPGEGDEPASAEAPGPPRDRPQPLSRMRRAIADHMTRSLQTAAHCTTIVEVDFSRVQEERRALGCTALPILARAAIDALRRHPQLNATLEEGSLTVHSAVNLGIAVSLADRGLIVPVVHAAHELSAEGLAERIGELARRAREDALAPDEVRGGTFTITNPGGYGSIASTPIINQPQVAILDLEAVVRRPVVVTDARGAEAIAIRPMAFLCLSWDHRALDGALAAQFLTTLRGRLEGE